MRAFGVQGRALACALVALASGCGFRSSLETDEPASIADGGCDPDGEGGAHDASTGDAPPPDGALIDHGTNGPDVDAALPRCTSNADCDGWATCQSGVCCSGTLVGTVCTCGRGGGCDLRSACCVPFSSTTRELECVSDCEATCGCTSPR